MTKIALPPLVDSHCHLNSIDLTEFDNNMDQVIAKARAVGIEHMLCVCVVPSELPQLQKLAESYPDVSFSVGVHPTETYQELDAKDLIALAHHPKCIAIGETGLDYYRIDTETGRSLQRQRFREHIKAAITTRKPLIIHTRQAANDTLLLMEEEGALDIGGVMHCFSEDWDVAKRALALNFYISFSGIVTFKNAEILREVAKKVPKDRILIETDAPYLAPAPFRGKQNHPALVKEVALLMSELLNMNYESFARQTTENFYRCFRINAHRSS